MIEFVAKILRGWRIYRGTCTNGTRKFVSAPVIDYIVLYVSIIIRS